MGITEFQQEELRMTLWAYAQRVSLFHMWGLLECAEIHGRPLSALCFSAALVECEQRHLLGFEAGLFQSMLEAAGVDADGKLFRKAMTIAMSCHLLAKAQV